MVFTGLRICQNDVLQVGARVVSSSTSLPVVEGGCPTDPQRGRCVGKRRGPRPLRWKRPLVVHWGNIRLYLAGPPIRLSTRAMLILMLQLASWADLLRKRNWKRQRPPSVPARVPPRSGCRAPWRRTVAAGACEFSRPWNPMKSTCNSAHCQKKATKKKGYDAQRKVRRAHLTEGAESAEKAAFQWPISGIIRKVGGTKGRSGSMNGSTCYRILKTIFPDLDSEALGKRAVWHHEWKVSIFATRYT